ncbi:beta-galactosidase [Kineosporia succinea]|uniref:Glycoside hydrolase 35 catalytic domain-containing protein n=1 Tax=Kineosporia succinea TaxID=84632 RepID=A0ABT9P8G1_9ACTN|nr:beta-galactosidase [Kineosporia succinea]MDP9828987.1 hypothetical protein [Kineosporia succinea]
MPELVVPAVTGAEKALPMGDARVAVTSRHLTRDGEPWIPVSGELHYSRVPRDRWRERLLLMRSGGVDVVSAYVIWIHHEPERGQARFDGDLDVAAFVRLCSELGLEVVLRLGPWVHGEVRNGGFPDWVQAEPVRHRTDDPAYLDLVRPWFQRLGQEISGAGGLLGLQLENELYTEPGHLLTLKRMALDAGMSAPLWTATAWGGADLPPREVFPLWAGYGDGFWVDASAGWEPNFRAHYFFSHEWDDPGVGADVRGGAAQSARTHDFPPATCELGGGMATTYHRRVVPSALDVAAVGNAKIGSGSVWQGYYMYAGGLNPWASGPVQESHATGYPNDLPFTDYDFHAPIGAAGIPAASHASLRRQHAFLAAFGAGLATMPSTLPPQRPRDLDDTTTLRWAVRSDGRSGFVFVNWHQPHVPLPPCRDVRLHLSLPEGELGIGPVDILAGTVAIWPFGLDLGGVTVHSATASVLTRLPGPVLVLVAEFGIDVELRTSAGDFRFGWRTGGTVDLDGPATVVVLAAGDADRVWVVDGRVLLCDHPLWMDGGVVTVEADREPDLRVLEAGTWKVLEAQPGAAAGRAAPVSVVREREAGDVPRGYGSFDGRASRPDAGQFAGNALVHRLGDVGVPVAGTRRLLEIEWAGDVAHLCVDGSFVADRFWDGTPWMIDLDAIPGAESGRVSVEILPLHPEAEVWLDREAFARRRAVPGPLGRVDAATLSRVTRWRSPAA